MSFWHFVAGVAVGNFCSSQANSIDLDQLSDDELSQVKAALFRDTLFVCLCRMNIDEHGCYDDTFFEHFIGVGNPDSREELETFANEVIYGNSYDEYSALAKFHELFESDQEAKKNLIKRLKLMAPSPLTATAKLVLENVEMVLNR